MIIAVDFDNTLFKTNFPNIGEPILPVIEFCKARQQGGDIIILWTCRRDDDLLDATRACQRHGLEFDYVNCNEPNHLAAFKNNDCRKIFADVYIDDKSITPQTIQRIMNKNKTNVQEE